MKPPVRYCQAAEAIFDAQDRVIANVQRPSYGALIAKLLNDHMRRDQADYCEHGIKDGDWCLPCNLAMKEAVKENQCE